MEGSPLLVRPSASGDGVRHRITPESAGWRYVGFETRGMQRGAREAFGTGERENCVVVLSGKARVTAGAFDSG
ncbi:MAG: 5-deoxy-glucuronate isomerase, partial [Hyphomicrobiales bacterium]|nr:5-deoxy-glucuronate isomerase [Hyphomicrobiales bacterium]